MLRKPIMLGTTWLTILVSLGKEAASNINDKCLAIVLQQVSIAKRKVTFHIM